jgi:hypothetical protein
MTEQPKWTKLPFPPVPNRLLTAQDENGVWWAIDVEPGDTIPPLPDPGVDR